MRKKEFDKRRTANIRALELMAEKPALKVIELVEILLEQDRNLAVVVNVEGRELSIISVLTGGENNVRLQAQGDHGQDRGSRIGGGRDQAERWPALFEKKQVTTFGKAEE